MEIKILDEIDIDLLLLLWKEFHDSHHKDMIVKNFQHAKNLKKDEKAEDIFKSFIADKMKSKEAFIQVAYSNKELAGYLVCFIKENNPIFAEKKIGVLSDLYLRQAYRKKGFATKLKDNALDWLKKKGIHLVSIALYPENGLAHDVYKHWGFHDFHIEMRLELK